MKSDKKFWVVKHDNANDDIVQRNNLEREKWIELAKYFEGEAKKCRRLAEIIEPEARHMATAGFFPPDMHGKPPRNLTRLLNKLRLEFGEEEFSQTIEFEERDRGIVCGPIYFGDDDPDPNNPDDDDEFYTVEA
jgi:hypothetical protein